MPLLADSPGGTATNEDCLETHTVRCVVASRLAQERGVGLGCQPTTRGLAVNGPHGLRRGFAYEEGQTMSSFEGKVAVVTGSGKGFGAATTKRFAELGADVVINHHRLHEETTRLVAEVEKLGRGVLCIQADVTDREAVRQMFKTAYDTFGHIDILVNNAGVSRMKEFEAMSDDDWDYVLDTNLKSMFITTQEAFPYFKKNNSSRIVNVASMSGQLAGPTINYGVSKAGVIQLTRNTARYGAPYNILVNAVAPGVILTEMTREELETPVGQAQVNLSLLKRPGQVRDVVQGIVFLASFDHDYITGHTLNINGGTI
jgi:3-oxoacyl-[acyl-carrier protein] reductase